MEHAPLSLADTSHLRASLDVDTPIMLLIDPLLGEPVPPEAPAHDEAEVQAMREAMWQRPIACIALSPRTPLPPHQHPYLVELEGRDDAWLDASLEIAHDERMQAQADGLDGEGAAAHCIGGWLQSSMHLPQLAGHLSGLLHVNTTARTKATYLRLADRRVLALLRYAAGDAAVALALGRVQKWLYLDACGQLSTLASAGETAVPLQLDPDPWATLQDGERANRAMALWLGEAQRRGLGQVCGQPSQVRYASLFNALARAREAARTWPHRFPDLLDQSAWAALLLLDPAIEHSDAVRRLLNRTGALDDPAEAAEPVRHLYRQIHACLSGIESPLHAPAQA